MDDRLRSLLRIVVEDVVKTGEPVGSQRLVDAYGLDVSSATIRNWFAELEKAGVLAQPHTSSGRLPTELGYRRYVDELMVPSPLSSADEQALAKAEDARQLAKIATELVNSAAFLGTGEDDSYYTGLSRLFAQPEFHEWTRVVSLGDVLDRLDDVLRRIRQSRFESVSILIGSECPFGNACSSLMMTLPDGNLFGLLGPMRMDYQRAKTVLQKTHDIAKNF